MKHVADNLLPEKIFQSNSPTQPLQETTLMPFLGLKDKHGKIICFGDVLIDDMKNLLMPVVEIENNEHVLFFKPIKHLKNPLLNMGCKSTYSNTLEILGNIYTNRKLFLLVENEYNKYK